LVTVLLVALVLLHVAFVTCHSFHLVLLRKKIKISTTLPNRVGAGTYRRGDAGTNPSRQRWFLPVLPTTLARLLLRSQAERKALCS